MHLVSIQGKYAPSMQLKGEELHVCHQLLRSLSDNQYLVINSKFRTDILYSSPNEKNLSIIRLWCMYKGKAFDDIWISRFFQAVDSHKSLEHFFTRLLLLKRMHGWYSGYMDVLASVLQNESGQIAKMVRECLEAFTEKNIFDPPEVSDNNQEMEFSDTLSIVSEVLSKYNSN